MYYSNMNDLKMYNNFFQIFDTLIDKTCNAPDFH